MEFSSEIFDFLFVGAAPEAAFDRITERSSQPRNAKSLRFSASARFIRRSRSNPREWLRRVRLAFSVTVRLLSVAAIRNRSQIARGEGSAVGLAASEILG